MNHLNGRVKVIEASAVSMGVGTTLVPIRPLGVGLEWEIIWAIGVQDDGAVANGWRWYEPEHPAGVILYQLIGAAGAQLPLGALAPDLPNVSMHTWWTTWDRYPCYSFEASAAGKNGTILALVIEHLGVEGLE